VTRREGTRETLGEGKHICTLDIGRARVVRDGIGGAGSEHGWGELRRTRLHEHARITMVPTMPRWPPVGGHPAMVVAIKMQLGRTQKRSGLEGGVKGARLLFRRSLIAVSLPCVLHLCLVPALSEEAGAGIGAGAGG
jgi:hypothetical protein